MVAAVSPIACLVRTLFPNKLSPRFKSASQKFSNQEEDPAMKYDHDKSKEI